MRTHLTRETLECLDAAVLAARCKGASEDPSVSPVVAEQAHALILEWTALIRKITPPLPDPRAEEKVEAAIEQVRMRMVDLLAAI
jgi:hypothetical protein